jgi:xanthine dehydrogenase molybdenum-binding subunit
LHKAVIETQVGRGPYNSMSIGETPIITVAPAIANAIHDAVGVRIKNLPVTSEKVFEERKNLLTRTKLNVTKR